MNEAEKDIESDETKLFLFAYCLYAGFDNFNSIEFDDKKNTVILHGPLTYSRWSFKTKDVYERAKKNHMTYLRYGIERCKRKGEHLR